MKQILCFGDSNTWGLIPKTSETDHEHLSAEGHARLAEAIFKKVKEIRQHRTKHA